MPAQKSWLWAAKNPSRTEVCASSRHVPDAAHCFLNTEKTPSTYFFSALYYIYLSFKVSFLLSHSSGKTGLSACSLTKQLKEWNCWTGTFTQTPLLSCAGCWAGGSCGQPQMSTSSPNILKWDGDNGKDFITTAGLTKRGVLPRPDIFVKVASLKHPTWTEAPLNQASKIWSWVHQKLLCNSNLRFQLLRIWGGKKLTSTF